MDRVAADLEDAELKAPAGGRIQHQLARAGEVVGNGGSVLEMIDMDDVYMTVFLPEKAAGKLAIGAEARLVLDSAPDHPVPATVSYVASEARFTPETVETADEREELVFEVRLSIGAPVPVKFGSYAKVGLPGMAYVCVEHSAPRPESLAIRVPPEGEAK